VTRPPLSCRGRRRRTRFAWLVVVTAVPGPPYVEGAVSVMSSRLVWWRRRGHSSPVPAAWRWPRRRVALGTLCPCAVAVVEVGEGGVCVRSTRAFVHQPYFVVGARCQRQFGCRAWTITRSERARPALFLSSFPLGPLTRVVFLLPPPSTSFLILGCNGRCRRRLLLRLTCSTRSRSRAWRLKGRRYGPRPRRCSRRCPPSRVGQAVLLLRPPLP